MIRRYYWSTYVLSPLSRLLVNDQLVMCLSALSRCTIMWQSRAMNCTGHTRRNCACPHCSNRVYERESDENKFRGVLKPGSSLRGMRYKIRKNYCRFGKVHFTA